MNKKKIIYLIHIFVLTAFISCGGTADHLEEGSPAPLFTLKDHKGNTFSLSDYHGKNVVVLFFYPKASTPGCTKQACGIRDASSEFEKNNVVVFGISVDSPEAIAEFAKDNNLEFPLLSDEDKAVSQLYGVLNDIGFSNRISFVIDKNSDIVHIMRDVQVSFHAEEILDIAKKFN